MSRRPASVGNQGAFSKCHCEESRRHGGATAERSDISQAIQMRHDQSGIWLAAGRAAGRARTRHLENPP